MVGLLGNLAQLFCNEPSLIITSCFPTPLCCSYLIVSMKESCRCSPYYHSSTLLVLTSSLSLNTCCFDCWLWMVTSSTTLTSTLLVLGGLGANVALDLTCLILNMLCASIFWGNFSETMFYATTNYIVIMNSYFSWFNKLSFNSCYGFYRLNCKCYTTGTSFFLLWQVPSKWPILPQFV